MTTSSFSGVTVATQAYKCVSNALDDGFGIAEIHLEALASP